jgi:hypothetical protein
MASFVINGTEFGINAARSRFTVTRSFFRGASLDVEIEGEPALFDALKLAEDSAWSWALYPPSFYLRTYPIPKPKATQALDLRLQPGDTEKYDIALYMMEHNPVADVTIHLVADSEIVIAGRVELFGEPGEFRIEWKK